MIWGETVVPPFNAGAHGGTRPYFRDFARWAGVPIPADADSTLLWTNLLKGDDGATWFGLVHAGHDGAAVSGRTWWPGLPEGIYQVSELVNPRELGTLDAARLRTDGVPVTLQPHEEAVFKLKRRAAKP